MKNIAILAGGPSSERVISIQTANRINESLSKENNTFIIDIDGESWIYNKGKDNETNINKNDFSLKTNNTIIKFDLAVIAIHGKQGEDGLLQAYFEMMGIPCSTSNVLSSALSFDKIRCKRFLKNFGINITDEIILKKYENYNTGKIVESLGLPLFIKPNTAGSSFGITKVYEEKDIPAAIDHAYTEDDTIIIEKFIEGIEVSCGVFKTSEHDFVFPVTEIDTKRDFFDYDAKYTPELTDEITPARIPDNETRAVQEASSMIYDELNCHGIIRVDFIIKGGIPFFLEANTIPGMSKNSIVPKQIREAGYTEKYIFDLLTNDSIRRG